MSDNNDIQPQPPIPHPPNGTLMMTDPDHPPIPPIPHPPANPQPTSRDLLKTMHLSLGNELYHTYFQHWELFQRGHIKRQVFDNGVCYRYPMLDTPGLLLLHARIANIQVDIPEPYSKADYTRLVLACNVVFMNGDMGLDALMKAHGEVITRMRIEMERRGSCGDVLELN